MDADESSGRSRRQKSDKSGRSAAFERLKSLKGSKNKCEVTEVEKVWTDVNEKDYSLLVQQRQDEDWIIDDDGLGYVEDGREIFDDEYDGNAPDSKKPRNSNTVRKGRAANVVVPSTSGGGGGGHKMKDLKSMFMAMPAKKKVEKEVRLEEDDLLDGILQDLHNEPVTTPGIRPTILKKKKTPVAMNRNIVSEPLSLTPTRTASKPKIMMKPRLFLSEMNENDHGFVTEKAFDGQKGGDSASAIEEYDSEMMGLDFDEPMDVHEDDPPEISQFETQNKQETNTEVEKPLAKDVSVFEASFSDDWDDICANVTSQSEEVDALSVKANCDLGLPLIDNQNGDSVLNFFWLDAYEDPFHNPGVAYLFGKVWLDSSKTYVSCCIIVKNIERKVFFLPREKKMDLKTKSLTKDEVSFMDVYKEISDMLAEKYKIMQFRSRKVEKRYCFDRLDVPDVAEYLELKYPPTFPQLASDLTGQTFSHVFGTNASSLETLLLDRRIMGPCWLEIKCLQPSNPPISWCKIEAIVTKPEHLSVIQGKEVPPVVLLAFGLKTVINPKSQQNEIVAATCLVHKQFPLDKSAPNPPFQEHFCALTRHSDAVFPFDFKDCVSRQNRFKVERLDSERSLLGFLLAKIQQIDPDIIIGHDVVHFDLDVLLHRLTLKKVPHWSRIGRLKRSIMPKNSISSRGSATCGRLLCDVKIVAKELIRSKSYDLTELTRVILKKERLELETRNAFNSSVELFKLIEWSLLDVSYCLKIVCEINALPLALQITTIAGNVMSRTLMGGRSERNEFLLLHAFSERDYIVPDKQYGKKPTALVDAVVANDDDADAIEVNKSGKQGGGRRKAAFAGGLVLEPKRGFYDKYILLMDFNSLYPSIIQEFNVCFTSMPRAAVDQSLNDTEDFGMPVPNTNCPLGVLPTEIRKLVESRRQVKQLLKKPDLSADLKTQYDIRQQALKLTANSMYGCLGFANSRFYAKPLAAFVTSKGREILLQTKDLVQKIGLDVIYGDTDSLMINSGSTDLDHVLKLGNKLKGEINKLYRLLEIEIDGVFKSILLLKKKKYAALSIQKLPNGELVSKEEIKGLDIVRRDWSELASEAGRFVIHEILSGKQTDQIIDAIQSYLSDLKVQILNGHIPLSKLTITKQLTKNPEDYSEKASVPHVNVALRLNSRGGKKIKQGDTVAYVICEDSSSLSAMQRAYHLDELKTNEILKIDKHYYLAQQVHPVVSRLCDPFDGLDAVVIAECLGLDSNSYRKNVHVRHDNAEEEALLGKSSQSDSSRFESCEPFTFRCLASECSQEIVFKSPFRGEGSETEFTLSRCLNPSCKLSPASYVNKLNNCLVRSIRGFIQRYYQGWMVCDDPICNTRTRRIPLRFHKGQPICSTCEKGCLYSEYSESQLYNQLCFYQYVFDPERASKTLAAENVAVDIDCQRFQQEYGRLRATVTGFLDTSAYSVVDLTLLFQRLKR